MNFKHVALASGFCLLTATAAIAAPQNLISNGNFEQFKNGSVVGWDVSEGVPNVKNDFSSEKNRGHVAQIKFVKWSPHGAYYSQSVEVKPNTQYRFSFNARMNTGNIRISISGGEGDDKVSIVEYGRASHLSMFPLFWDAAWYKYLVFQPHEWRPVVINFNTGNATKVYVSFGGYQRKGIYSFDDVTLVEIPK